MSKIELLRAFVNERLKAAAEEICGAVEKTIEEYEESFISREQEQREMLNIVIKPDIKVLIEGREKPAEPPQVKEEEEQIPTSQRAEESADDIVIFAVSPSPSVKSEHDLDLITTSSINQIHNIENRDYLVVNGEKKPEPPQVKEEEEQIPTSQRIEEPADDTVAFAVSPFPSVKSEHDLDLITTSSLNQIQNMENGGRTILFQLNTRKSTETIKVEAGVETSEATEPSIDCQSLSSDFPEVKNEDREDCVSEIENGEGSQPDLGNSDKGSTKSHEKSDSQSRCDPCHCKLCGKSFSYKANLLKHASCHADNQEFLCGICGARLDSSENLTHHLESHVKERKTCPTCGKDYSTEALLRIHMRVHTGEMPYSCKDCGRRFRKISCLHSHTRIHTGEKPYKCNMCFRKFSYRATCIKHIKTIHKDKMYTCRDCGKEFSDQSNLNAHMAAHKGKKPYSCDFCGKEFKYAGNLDIHKKVHTEGIIYNCDVCGRGFSQQRAFQRHRKAHSGQKPHICTICNKGFISSENLDTHMRIHTEEKPYKCGLCPKRFISQKNCKMHMRFHRENS
ncbi:zinc finger protein 383-like [Centroberyx affinis]|uniref:zinc finger protein 383-like n=1 Tax=Centroberyx affinis TaxID=166261 RepID=UPI003A5C317D